jgi:ubiquinone/menaquinone biosynthesis C-methylase UbiE
MSDREQKIREEEIRLHETLAEEYVKRRASAGSQLFDAYWNQEVIKCLDTSEAKQALDCCCGDGILLPDLAERYDKVIGLDISEAMLKLAAQREPREKIELVCGEVEHLPFADNAFDAITFRGAFHHVSDPAQSMKEVHRILRPGGQVVFFEPNGDPWIWRAARRLYYAMSHRFSSGHRSYRARELHALLEGAGLQPTTTKRLFYLAYPFAGLLDHFKVFRFVPFHAALTRFLLAVDRVLAMIPGIQHLGFALVVVAEKPARS